ncbi:MAG: hypothetical protein HRU15_04625 [Planctomycetes bacterium]|nr:hypothetical protein [Planctomycetota bacterium]
MAKSLPAGQGLPVKNTVQHSGALIWTPDSKWQEQVVAAPTSAFAAKVLKTYTMADGVSLVISEMPGDAGGLMRNVNRWRGQVGLVAASEQSLANFTKLISSAAGDFLFMRLINNDQPDKALCGAVFFAQENTVFVKFIGTQAVIEQHSSAVSDFCARTRVK